MAQRESVLYRGERFWLQTSGAYFQSGRTNRAERLLHRRVWIDAHGPIPAGHDIHHRDENWRNNAPDNLELCRRGEHQRQHMLARNATPAGRRATFAALERARAAAPAWHRSADGRAWHRQHAQEGWARREPIQRTCRVCGTSFEAYFARARYCSPACSQSVQFRTYFTDHRVCAYCHQPFMANRHRATACCSRVCSNRVRHADRRL